MGQVSPVGSNSMPYRPTTGTAIQEKHRVGYHKDSQRFEPLAFSDTAKIEQMERVEQQVNRLPIPVDYTSPTYLKKVAPPSHAKGVPLQSNTRGVKDFLQGEATLYPSFISSVSEAQRNL